MFSKNNMKYIAILALGFFWCSSVYLTQEQYLLNYASENFINIVELLFGSIAMALGILIFGIIYRNSKNIKNYYLIFTILALISSILFFLAKNNIVMSILLCLTCIFGTAGFGAGYHFSLLAANVLKEYRGRVFAIGYGLGSIGTYLLILLPESFYCTSYSLTLYIPVILLTLFLVLRNTTIEIIEKEKYSKSFKNNFIKLSVIVLAMSLLSALSTDAISVHTINISGGYGNTRIYYCLGLLIAGFLVDKKKNFFDNITIASFIFSLLAIILLQNNYSIHLIAALSYFFIGFFVLFRTISFINLVDTKKSIVFASAFGLMYSRIMEGLLTLVEDRIITNYTILIITISIVLFIVLFLYLTLYVDLSKTTEEDVIKNIVVKYKLSNQEKKVLTLLVNGKSNQEIADSLYISLYTAKRHVANIYKKTNMNKTELIEKCYLGLK